MAFGVHSEVGKLRKVMVHRPGLEHRRLTPSNAEELLFDDVLWVERAEEEHDAFCKVMRDRGVEVFLAEELFTQTLQKPDVKEWVCEHVLGDLQVGLTASQRAREGGRRRAPARCGHPHLRGDHKGDGAEERGGPG